MRGGGARELRSGRDWDCRVRWVAADRGRDKREEKHLLGE